MSSKKYYLGLDLGISSVGWAVMAEKNDNYYIDDFGVRLFESSESPKDGTTEAEKRRGFRSSRRLIQRRKQRINELKRFLERNNIISKTEINSFYSTFKITNNIEYDENKYFNPYVIRVKGLTQKLNPDELAVALIHIANHRGYNDKFSFGEEKDNKKSKLTSSIDAAEELVKQHKTIAQAILADENFKNKENNQTLGLIHNKNKKDSKLIINNKEDSEQKAQSASSYRYLFDRKDYRKELALILENQEKYYPQLSKENREYIINEIILRQRDFEVGPGPKDKQKYENWKTNMPNHRLFESFISQEGKCTFYPSESRGYRSSLVFELFRFISDLSTFTVKILDENQIKEFGLVIFDQLKKGEIFDKTKLKSFLKERFNLKEETFKRNKAWQELKINFSFLKILKEIMPNEFKSINIDNLSEHIFNKIGKILHENITPRRREEKLSEFFKENQINLDEETLENFLKFSGVSTSNASMKYMIEAIKAFIDGISYGVFQADFNNKNELKMFEFNSLSGTKMFDVIQDSDLKKNAVVFRAINQARKVIKALHQKYNVFEVINVEIARELAKSFEQRKVIKNQNDINFKQKIEIEEILKKHNLSVNSTNIKKYRLWEQQNRKCIYCENHHDILLEDFDRNVLQVDHIIPQSKFSDDSINNLVLCCSKSNQEKQDQTPLQWLANNEKQKISYLNFVKEISNKLSDKKNEYLNLKSLDDEILENFASRNLNDTRYITRYFINWLKSEFKNHENKTGEVFPTKVQAILGSVTSRFRRIWLNGSGWGLDEKVREITHFHHAVDAMILTQFLDISYINYATDVVNIIYLKKVLAKNKITLDVYNKSIEEILAKWKINKLRPDLGTRLEKLAKKESINYNKILPPLVTNLKEIVEARIPVILKIGKESKEIKLKNSENVEVKVVRYDVNVPKFVEVLNQEIYYTKIRNLNLKGDLHYPFISFKINRKLSGSLTSSQVPVNQKYERKIDKFGNKIKKLVNYENNSSYIKDKHNTLWEINNYHGVVFDKVNDFKPIWIRKIEAKKELLKYQKQNLLVSKMIVEYTDKNTGQKVLKVFHGKMSASIYANLLGTTNIQVLNKSKEKFNNQNYYDSISNWKKDFKILEPNILGKIVAK